MQRLLHEIDDSPLMIVWSIFHHADAFLQLADLGMQVVHKPTFFGGRSQFSADCIE